MTHTSLSRWRSLALVLALLVAAVPAQGQERTGEPDAPDAALRPEVGTTPTAAAGAPVTTKVDTHIEIRADRTAVKTATTRIRILAESAIRGVGQQTRHYTEGMQALEIVEAYTEKADGRKIAVEPQAIFTRDASGGLATVYLDAKTITILFPDLAVGDATVLTVREETKATVFPGHFYHTLLFSRLTQFEPSSVTVVAPRGLGVRVAALGEGLSETMREDGDRVVRTIAYKPLPRLRLEPGATAALDRDPRVLVSTFADYEELGASYWTAAASRIEATPEIKVLADQITRGIVDRRAQAEAISRWVKRNVRYVAVFLGVGRVVPNPASAVLRNKYGDCKDHVTLMASLLAAKGIASEQALIHLGSAYTLPSPPTMAYLNHVILYLPEFDLYDDPTTGIAAFGVLSPTAYDKPVVRVSAAGARVARTPTMQPDDHVSVNRTRVVVAADGSVTGETVESGRGVFAMSARAAAARIQTKGLDAAAEERLRAIGLAGTGRYELSTGSNDDQAVIRGRFALTRKFKAEPGAVAPIPAGLAVLARPGGAMFNRRYAERKAPFVCLAGRQIEEIEIEFAPGLPLPQMLRPNTLRTKWFTYSAEYRLQNRTFAVRRELVSHVEHQVCDPTIEKELTVALTEVAGRMRSGMTFPKRGTTPERSPNGLPTSPPSGEAGPRSPTPQAPPR